MTVEQVREAVAEEAAGRTRPRHDIPALDAVRGLAATAVVATHVGFATGTTVIGTFGALVSRLDYGVAVFFLLSGFLLVRPWIWEQAGLAPRVSTRTYLRRRLFRIFPLYWVVLAVALVAIPANHGIGPVEVATNALLLQIYPPEPLPHGLTQTWSLGTEMSFYLVLPLLAWLLGRVSRRNGVWSPARALALLGGFAVVAFAFQLAVRWPGSPLPVNAGFWLPYHLDWFALGMALAVLQVAALDTDLMPRLTRVLRQSAPYLGTMWVLAALLFLLAATPLAGPRGFEMGVEPWSSVARSILYGLSAFFVLLPLVILPVGESRARRVLQSRPARLFGDVSYGIFLWHLLLLELVLWVLGIELFTGGFWTVFALTWVSTVAVSWVTYRVVERPALRLGHRGGLFRRARRSTGTPAS